MFKVEFRNPEGSTDDPKLEMWKEVHPDAFPEELRNARPWNEKDANTAAEMMRSRGYEARVVPE